MSMNLTNEKAAQSWADAFKSDPFAYQRMKLHLDSGYEDRDTKDEQVPGKYLVNKQATQIIDVRLRGIHKIANDWAMHFNLAAKAKQA